MKIWGILEKRNALFYNYDLLVKYGHWKVFIPVATLNSYKIEMVSYYGVFLA